ncbi:protein of unknown function [Burkholderia multivorans]
MRHDRSVVARCGRCDVLLCGVDVRRANRQGGNRDPRNVSHENLRLVDRGARNVLPIVIGQCRTGPPRRANRRLLMPVNQPDVYLLYRESGCLIPTHSLVATTENKRE